MTTDVRVSLQEKIYDPHTFLGLHSLGKDKKIIRLWRPGAKEVYFELLGKTVEAKRADSFGLFTYVVSSKIKPNDYRVFHQNGLLAADPYSMTSTVGEMDLYLFNRGVHYLNYQMLGAHSFNHNGVAGTRFVVWAPNAKSISLVADFNYFDGRVNPMRSLGASGLWELFVPGIGVGEKYKFEIRTQEGALRVKADPYAFCSELRPGTASIVYDIDRYQWNDAAWMQKRREKNVLHQPLNVYEVHLGSWRREKGAFLNYRQLAHELAEYCLQMHFSHVELLPVTEHPLDESWGYQVTGFYSATSRFGSPEDFQYLVDHLHQRGIGVFIDWVPAHFPTDDFSLAQFDGSSLYEHQDPRKGFHPHWNTCIFNYGRSEVSNFLIGSALFWLDKMHVDGLRVDAVASMLYLDYGRKANEWIPNIYGGNENLEAIEFLKHLNSAVHERFPGAVMIAEESTSFCGVTHPLSQGGLGFDLKWNMGWMNDTLHYFQRDPLYRHYHHSQLTFGLVYAFTEQFMLVFSHDEVVHGKASLLSKMPGDDWQKFANLRLLYSYLICQPGKKLLFMGGELGQWSEWSSADQISWSLLEYERHRQLHHFIQESNRLYHALPALWENDFSFSGFEWIDFSDSKNSVISYLRRGSGSVIVCVHNFTPAFFSDYFISLRRVDTVREIFNSDSEEFGGSGKINPSPSIVRDHIGNPVGMHIQLAPLATMIFEVSFVF